MPFSRTLNREAFFDGYGTFLDFCLVVFCNILKWIELVLNQMSMLCLFTLQFII